VRCLLRCNAIFHLSFILEQRAWAEQLENCNNMFVYLSLAQQNGCTMQATKETSNVAIATATATAIAIATAVASGKQQRRKNCGNMFEVFAFPT